jgi:4-hydroxybenzoate polyprenyltransferase
MNNRWWTYQKERFPVFAHGPMVIIFCLAVLTFSALQRGAVPGTWAMVGASISALLFFFQLRVADEFKDFDVDSRYRPHRPVPSGLVRLKELAWLATAAAGIQFFIAVQFDVGMVPLLVGVWAWIGLMTREFFVPTWLRKTPSAYLLSHMVVMPLIAFYISAFDWLPVCDTIPAGIGWLLLLAFCCGIVLEVGRKIRAPGDEREGVETYSALWGGRKSVLVWSLAILLSAYAYLNTSTALSDAELFIVPGVIATAVGIGLAACFLLGGRQRPAARFIEPGSGIVAMLLYLGLGPLQLIAG